MTFSSIYIKIPFPLDQHSSCFTIIESHFTVYDVIQKSLSQVYPNFNLNPNEYGIYVLPHGKWLFPNCKLSDYIEYISPMQIEQFQLRPKKLSSITVSCLQYKTTILCDPNQSISILSKRAAEIFYKQENGTGSSSMAKRYIKKSQSHTQNIPVLDDTQQPLSVFAQDSQSENFFDWDSWSVWYRHRFVPDDTPCSMLNLCEVQLRRETEIRMNPLKLFKESLRETLVREQNLERKEKREKREHRKEKKHIKVSDMNDNKRAHEAPVEMKSKSLKASTLGPKLLGPLNLSSVSNAQKSPKSARSPRSPRSSRSGHSSHSSRHDSGDILDSFFDKNETQIPIFLEYIFQKIESNPKVEGIFRKSGLQLTIDAFIEKVDSMYQSIYSEIDTPNSTPFSAFKEELKTFIEAQQLHDIVGILKTYFRLLPESVIPRIFFDKIFQASSITDDETRLLLYKSIVSSMPQANFALLKRLSKCLNIVISYSDENKMNLLNIVICLFPALIKNRTDVDQSTLISQSKVQSIIGYDLFEKKHAHFLYSRKSRKIFEVPSSTAKCISKVEGRDQIKIGTSYIILKDDKPNELLIFVENNPQMEVPLECFERKPPAKIAPFSDWTLIDQPKNLEFLYLPILAKNVNIGVNEEIKYQKNRIKSAKAELEDEVNELTDILSSLSKDEDINKDSIRKKLQEMSALKDYLY